MSPLGISEAEDTAGLQLSDRPSASNIDVKILDPCSDLAWDRLVARHRDCTFFHSSAWAKILTNTYGHKPLYLSFFKQSRQLALVPLMDIRSSFTGRRGVCLPFSDFCEPLIFDKSVAETVLNKIHELAHNRNWQHFEIRGGREMLSAAASSRQFYGHKLGLSESGEELMARFGAPVRRAIRKAQRSGLKAEVVNTRQAILEFYRLHVRTRRRHGIPPQPFSFFLNIYREAIEKGQGFVIFARSGARFLAGAVFLHFGRSAVYKFGASNESYQEFRGNNLVMWEAIQTLMRRGCQSLHFGRTAIENDGLRRFKMGWGTEEELIEYFQFDIEAKAWKNGARHGSGFHNRVFRRLPLVLNRLAGSVLYPHLD